MANFALEVTRLGFSLMQSVSPRLAGEAAFRLFCRTPSARPKGEKAKAAHAAGVAKLADAERFMLAVDGRRAHAYRLNGGALGRRKRYLVTHGWGSGMAYMADLVKMLAATGAEVIALDFPGHGRSGGRFLHMALAVKAIAAAEARFGRFDAVIGHSFGGAALMVSSLSILPDVKPVSAERMVLIGSPSEMQWLFTDFGRMLRLKPAAQAALEDVVQRITGRRLEDFDVGRKSASIGKPLLIIHAEDDKEVSAAHARRYAASGSHVRLSWANGFGHRRIMSAGPVLSEIAAFLAEEDIKKDAEIIPIFELPARRASV
ncbi:pimeloyl-ACP methyl ester carboxylesterase [Rhizobium sp. BK650]|uniref:alpha/beta hydrolase n=1 Tax=Rhizobium sp. BK650 TaxID=2586990 RepID=UPI00160835F0|nr:alpha/beta fold hydrolase [Rhizobium sp. BK650]MBB3656941.1 pimeloyl-ACP methyl ester carboxylesterase [Rhizobium sp. BK650]